MANDQNTRTLVAAFDDYSTAEQAANELAANGISRDSIDIQSNRKTAGAGQTWLDGEHEPREGGIAGWWHRLFGSEHGEDRDDYAAQVERGRTVLSATVPESSVDRAAAVLNQYGATDVDTRTASRPERVARGGEGESVPVVEEELQVGKRLVRTGGVRVYSRVVDHPVEEQITLREEHVRVERRPVNREISREEAARFRDQTIEVTEMREEPVISKRSRVKEEIVVGKEATERTETVRENVRRTEVNVEQLERSSGGNERAGRDERDEKAAASDIAAAPDSDYSSDWKRHFDSSYAASGVDYATVQPGYEYGSRIAADPEYRGKSWDEVENDIRSGYQREHPSSRWDDIKDAIRHGWDKVTGKG